jgi:hypothetical protein
VEYYPETFFRPDEIYREPNTLPANLFNRCRLLVNQSETGCVFVPIRSMQFQAVIGPDEIVFVDSQGGYAVREGEGGRIIVLAWDLRQKSGRDSLTEPVSIELVYFELNTRHIHQRLMSEFPSALQKLEQRKREEKTDSKCVVRILSLQPKISS